MVELFLIFEINNIFTGKREFISIKEIIFKLSKDLDKLSTNKWKNALGILINLRSLEYIFVD